MKPIDPSRLNGTSLKGVIRARYEDLIRTLGEPHRIFDSGKVDVEWAFETKDGDAVVLYNYKDGPACRGKDGKPINQVTEWSIGANKTRACERLVEYIKNKLEGK